jgi:hypothetical protein
MRKLKNVTLLAIAFASLIAFNSCSDDSNNDTVSQSTAGTTNGTGGNGNSATTEKGSITLYRIEGDNIVKVEDYKVTGQDLEYQKDTQKHQEIWTLVKKVVPTEYRTKMTEFLIYNGTTDGSAGFVIEKNSDLTKWKMGIAINYASDKQELIYTVIHEFGHILTLNNDQVDASIIESSCTNYFTGEGCAKSNSYIYKLQSQFWGDIWSQFITAQKGGESELQEFYTNNSTRFVTQYAATNPGEDIAEVFATFVTRNTGANGNSIAEQKIQLMYNYPELVSLRNYIRKNLSYTARNLSSGGALPAPGSWKKANSFGNPTKSH